MKKLILSLTVLAGICLSAQAESSVWKAVKGDSVTYIGGTCHVLRPSDFPLPSEFKTAYEQSDTLVFETDIAQLNTLDTQQKMLSQLVYRDGSTIGQHISAETYEQLSQYCAANNIPLEQIQSFKPSMILLAMTLLELNKLGATAEGVDALFSRQAALDGKQIQALETIDQQIGFITQLGKENPDEFIKQMIKEVIKTKEDYPKMVAAWKAGDAKMLYQLIVEMKAADATLYNELLRDRNKAWLPIIESYSQTPSTEFVLVGVAHLVGPDCLLKSLKKKGYSITKL